MSFRKTLYSANDSSDQVGTHLNMPGKKVPDGPTRASSFPTGSSSWDLMSSWRSSLMISREVGTFFRFSRTNETSLLDNFLLGWVGDYIVMLMLASPFFRGKNWSKQVVVMPFFLLNFFGDTFTD